MAVLKDPRHELFAQAWASGMSMIKAYVAAGFPPSRSSAHRLAARPEIRARVDEIVGDGAGRAAMTVERALRELAAIAFADIRQLVEWRSAPAGAGGAGSQIVRFVDSDRLDPATASAIAEVRRTPSGGLFVKMHDKQAALVALGRLLGMFRGRVGHGADGGPNDSVEHLTDEELERIVLAERDERAKRGH